MKRNKIISLILLVAFGLPGICSEGLHQLIPFGIGMIYHQNDQGETGSPSDSFPVVPLKFNPNCPLCHFCAQLIIVAAMVLFLFVFACLDKLVVQKATFPVLLFVRAYFLRGPPSRLSA